MLLHVCTETEWNRWKHEEVYTPSGFDKEGFIHCCVDRQLKGVLDRYFTNQPGLIVLVIDEAKLSSKVKYEPGTDQDLFPHVYGPINKAAVLRIDKL